MTTASENGAHLTHAASIALVGALTAALLVASCKEERPPVQSGSDPGRVEDSGATASFGPGTDVLPGCDTPAGPNACRCLDVPLLTDPPTLYFVLDRSGSMARDNRWNQVRGTVANIVRSLGARAKFGASLFPARSKDDACAPGEEVMSVRLGDPPELSKDGPTVSVLLAVTATTPRGGTPIAQTLQSTLSTLANGTGRKYVILATDGAPNCNPTATCSVETCQLNLESFPGCTPSGTLNCCALPTGSPTNCTERTSTLEAIDALANADIPTYVVGLPGVAPYAALLDEMAQHGKTARNESPFYYAVRSSKSEDLAATLRSVAAKIVGSCTFSLKDAPEDPERVNVYIDRTPVAYDAADGWSVAGTTVTLHGKSCERIMSGDALGVRIVEGCPRAELR